MEAAIAEVKAAAPQAVASRAAPVRGRLPGRGAIENWIEHLIISAEVDG